MVYKCVRGDKHKKWQHTQEHEALYIYRYYYIYLLPPLASFAHFQLYHYSLAQGGAVCLLMWFTENFNSGIPQQQFR